MKGFFGSSGGSTGGAGGAGFFAPRLDARDALLTDDREDPATERPSASSLCLEWAVECGMATVFSVQLPLYTLPSYGVCSLQYKVFIPHRGHARLTREVKHRLEVRQEQTDWSA